MPTLRTRSSKGSALTHNELDANFQRPVQQKTTDYTTVVGDNRSIIECLHAVTPFTITLGVATDMDAAETGDYEVTVANIGAALVTVTRSSTDTIDGQTSIVLKQYESRTFKVNSAGDGWISTSGANRVVQVVNTIDSAVATGTTQWVLDDTIPQNTEGDEYMTLAITPTSSSNKLLIEAEVNLSHSAAIAWMAAGLFQDSTASALAASWAGRDNAIAAPCKVTLSHYMDAGTTSSTTFKIRAGTGIAGTTTFNGITGGRSFGGVMASSITITEIRV